MARLGPRFWPPKSPWKSLCGSPFFVLSQEMRHINFFLGAQKWGFWGGRQKVYVAKVYVLFPPLIKTLVLLDSALELFWRFFGAVRVIFFWLWGSSLALDYSYTRRSSWELCCWNFSQDGQWGLGVLKQRLLCDSWRGQEAPQKAASTTIAKENTDLESSNLAIVCVGAVSRKQPSQPDVGQVRSNPPDLLQSSDTHFWVRKTPF